MGSGIIRLQRKCSAETVDRLLQPPLLPERVTEIVVSFHEIRFKVECSTIAGNRFLQSASLIELLLVLWTRSLS